MSRNKAPSFQFYPRDYMADPDVQAMSWEQRGRYHWALCCSALSGTPGVADEVEWRSWMGYTEAEWMPVCAVHARCFRIAGTVWTQVRLKEMRTEQRIRYAASHAGADATNARLSAEERSFNARHAAEVRWGKGDSAHAEMRAPCAPTEHPMRGPASASASASAKTKEKDLRMRAENPPAERVPEIHPAGPSWTWDKALRQEQTEDRPGSLCDPDAAHDAVADFEAACVQADAHEAANGQAPPEPEGEQWGF